VILIVALWWGTVVTGDAGYQCAYVGMHVIMLLFILRYAS
jgi:hypothetical protein